MRFGQVQRLRTGARLYGPVADFYIRVFGTTSLFALNCFWLLRKTLRNLDPQPSKILDGGCGKGDFTFAVATVMPEADVVGLDISEAKSETFDKYKDNIEVCQELNEVLKVPNVRFERQDLLHLDVFESYDFIFCIHVLEHILDSERVIENLSRALRPGGHLYIQMPSRSDLRIKRMGPFLVRRMEWERIEHVGTLSRAELEARVEAAGLRILRSDTELGWFLTMAWQGREALVSSKRVFIGGLLLPWLKTLVFLHRWLADHLRGPYRRWSIRRAGVSDATQGNLELLAQKPRLS